MPLMEPLPHNRLSLLYWCMAVATLICAAVALFAITRTERHLDEIVKLNNVKIALNHEMAQEVQVISRVIHTLVLLRDAAEVDTLAREIFSARPRYDQAWAQLQTLPTGAAGQRARADMQAATTRTRKRNDELIALARAGHFEQAAVLLRTQAAPETLAYVNTANAAVAAEMADNAAAYAAAVDGHWLARGLLTGMSLLCVALSLLFGWMSRRAVVSLGQTLAERNRLIDMLAHEVAQPLNNASAAIEATLSALTAQGLTQADPAAPLVRAQTVLNGVKGSLSNTLAAARLVAEEREIAVQDSDIDTVVGLALGDLDDAARSRVHVKRSTQTRTAAMNSDLMRLALRNLLINAVKYSPADSAVEVDILDSDDPLALVLEVRDHGSGIAPELRRVIFERGVRGPQAGAASGMGLGLYIAARVVALHRGAIEVLDNKPQGSVFRVVLPQAIFN